MTAAKKDLTAAKKRPDSSLDAKQDKITVKHDGWEADCRGGTVQDMLDWTALKADAEGMSAVGLAARLIEDIRSPDGQPALPEHSPSGLVVAVLRQHPFFVAG